MHLGNHAAKMQIKFSTLLALACLSTRAASISLRGHSGLGTMQGTLPATESINGMAAFNWWVHSVKLDGTICLASPQKREQMLSFEVRLESSDHDDVEHLNAKLARIRDEIICAKEKTNFEIDFRNPSNYCDPHTDLGTVVEEAVLSIISNLRENNACNLNTSFPTTRKTLIVGGGPSGLLFALNAKDGERKLWPITIVDMREQNTRGQLFSFQTPTRRLLSAIFGGNYLLVPGQLRCATLERSLFYFLHLAGVVFEKATIFAGTCNDAEGKSIAKTIKAANDTKRRKILSQIRSETFELCSHTTALEGKNFKDHTYDVLIGADGPASKV